MNTQTQQIKPQTDALNKHIALDDRVILPCGDVERVTGFEDEGYSVVHGKGGWITPCGWVVRV